MHQEDLVRRAAGSDMKAFVALVRQFQQAAFGSALALLHDFGRAEDVVQEAFSPPGRDCRLSPIPARFLPGSVASFATMRSERCVATR